MCNAATRIGKNEPKSLIVLVSTLRTFDPINVGNHVPSPDPFQDEFETKKVTYHWFLSQCAINDGKLVHCVRDF